MEHTNEDETQRLVDEWWEASIKAKQFTSSKYRLSLNDGADVLLGGYFDRFNGYDSDALLDIWYRNEVRAIIERKGQIRVRARWDIPSPGVIVQEADLRRFFETNQTVQIVTCMDARPCVDPKIVAAREAEAAARENREPMQADIGNGHICVMHVSSGLITKKDGDAGVSCGLTTGKDGDAGVSGGLTTRKDGDAGVFRVRTVRSGEGAGRTYDLTTDRVHAIDRVDLFRSELEFLQVYGGPRTLRGIEDPEITGGELYVTRRQNKTKRLFTVVHFFWWRGPCTTLIQTV